MSPLELLAALLICVGVGILLIALCGELVSFPALEMSASKPKKPKKKKPRKRKKKPGTAYRSNSTPSVFKRRIALFDEGRYTEAYR